MLITDITLNRHRLQIRQGESLVANHRVEHGSRVKRSGVWIKRQTIPCDKHGEVNHLKEV